MTPKNPLCSVTGRTVRIGCCTLPADKSRNALAMAGINSSIRKTARTCSSVRNIGGVESSNHCNALQLSFTCRAFLLIIASLTRRNKYVSNPNHSRRHPRWHAMFIWSSIAHMALPLGKTGIKELPNQQAIFAALQAGLGDKGGGLYLFPGLGVG